MGGENRKQKRAADAYRKTAGPAEVHAEDRAAGKPAADAEIPADESSPQDAAGAPTAAFTKTTGLPAADSPAVDAPLAASDERAGLSPDVPRPGAGIPIRDAPPAPFTGPQRVARLLIAMGPDRAAEVLLKLGEDEVESITQAVIQTPGVSAEDARHLLESIGRMANRRASGGPGVAREMLVRAFGEERGETLFRQAVPEPAPHHFDFLGDLESHQIRLLLRDESAGAIAVIVPHLEQKIAAEILQELAPERQAEVVRRVSHLGRLNREVVVRIEEALKEKIRRQGRPVSESIDGNETLAAILRHMAPSEGSAILQALAMVDPEVSESIRERLYTTDLLLTMARKDLADLFREFTDSEIALFLKGKSEELRIIVLRAVSERRREIIAEEYAHLGAQKRADVDEITSIVMERMRSLEETGAILVPREGDRYI